MAMISIKLISQNISSVYILGTKRYKLFLMDVCYSVFLFWSFWLCGLNCIVIFWWVWRAFWCRCDSKVDDFSHYLHSRKPNIFLKNFKGLVNEILHRGIPLYNIIVQQVYGTSTWHLPPFLLHSLCEKRMNTNVSF